MEMRKRGYDVQSRSADTGYLGLIHQFFDKPKLNELKIDRHEKESRKKYVQRAYNQAMNQLEKEGDGARGFFSIMYDKTNGAGHIMYWEVTNGTAMLYDPQSGRQKVMEECISFSDPSSWIYIRTDNLKLQDGVTRAVMSVPDRNKKKR